MFSSILINIIVCQDQDVQLMLKDVMDRQVFNRNISVIFVSSDILFYSSNLFSENHENSTENRIITQKKNYNKFNAISPYT